MLYSSVVGDIPFFFLKSGLNSNRKVQKKWKLNSHVSNLKFSGLLAKSWLILLSFSLHDPFTILPNNLAYADLDLSTYLCFLSSWHYLQISSLF
jgi:hypothetical protein